MRQILVLVLVIFVVAAAGGVGVEALVLQVPAQRDVLGPPELGVRQLLSAQVGGRADARPDDQERATGGAAGDDPDRLAVRLDVGVDRRVGAQEAGVEGAGEQRGHLLRAGIVGVVLEGHVGPQRAGYESLLDADQGGCVGQVWKVPEAERDRSGVGAGGRRGAGCSAGRQHHRRQEPGQPYHGRGGLHPLRRPWCAGGEKP
jgi:hypothetical protein